MDILLVQLRQIFTTEILDIGGAKFSAATIISLAVSIILAFIISKSISGIVQRKILNQLKLDRGLQAAVTVFIKYFLITISIIIILQTAGINLSSIAVIGGVIGIGIGFGLQNIASNFISGLVLLFEQSIKVGDYIEIGNLKGIIEKIAVRSTVLRTTDDLFVIVPNQHFLDNETVNWSYAGHTCRIHIPIGVSYHTDVLVLTEALLTAARLEPRVLSNPAPEVWFEKFGEHSLDFELLVWINEPSANKPIRSSLNFLIAHQLRQKNIEIPFPTREIIFKNPETIQNLINEKVSKFNTETSNSSITFNPESSSIHEKSNYAINRNLHDLLRKISYFERCTEVELFALVARGYRKYFKENEIIFREDEPSENFFIILSGNVEIFSEKNNQLIATLGEGEFFGEISLLTGTPRTATVRSLTADTLLFVVDRQQLQKLLSEHRELGEQIALKLSERQQILISLGLLNEEELQNAHYAALSWVRDRLNSLFGISLGIG